MGCARPLACRVSCNADLKSITGMAVVFEVHVRQFRLHNRAHDEVPRHLPAAIQIHGGQNRLQRIDQKACFGAPATFFFAAAEAHVLANMQLLGDVQQMPLPYQVSAQLGKLPFMKFREALKQRLAGHQA